MFDPALALAADVLDDAEKVRIANANRLQILTRDAADADGHVRGFGLDERHPDVAQLAALVQTLQQVEHTATRNLERIMRRHPLHPWVQATKGCGAKQVARLLAAIGDPYWNTAAGAPRTVSQLWAYSGLHVLSAHGQIACDSHGRVAVGRVAAACLGHEDEGVAAKRRKGARANWSSAAKMRAYLIATSCVKQRGSPYRAVYEARRVRTAETHPEWSPGHSHNDGLRIAAKTILRDLWREARRLHGVVDDTSAEPASGMAA